MSLPSHSGLYRSIPINTYIRMYVSIYSTICPLTCFNTSLGRVRNRRGETRPVHIQPHHILSGRKRGHTYGVLKRRSNLNQISVIVHYWSNVGSRASIWSLLAVVDAEVSDIARGVVAIHNVPGEGHVGAVFVGLEVADNFMSICKCWAKMCGIKLQCMQCVVQAYDA